MKYYCTQVGECFDNNAFLREGMYAVRNATAARFIQVHHDGSLSPRGWNAVMIIADVKMYYSTEEEEYVLVNTKTDRQVVVFRGQSYDCALFIARRARAFGFAIYATDVPLEANDAEEA